MSTPSPFEAMFMMATGYVAPRCLHAVATLGVADQIEDTPRTAAEIAAALGLNADYLHRILRLLSVQGVFALEGNAFRHTESSRLLRSDHPMSARAFVRMIGDTTNWRSSEVLAECVKTGELPVSRVHPGGAWAYYAEHPEESAIFNAAMTAKSAGDISAVLGAYDFNAFKTVADIGGGRGHLLRAILEASPGTEGILFDQPHVVAESQALARERLRLVGGDFFAGALPAADAYILMHIIHDWADAPALSILRNAHAGAPAHAKLLLMEILLPPVVAPHPAMVLDIVMLNVTGGRERTRAEYEALLAAAGWRLDRIVEPEGLVAILEASRLNWPLPT